MQHMHKVSNALHIFHEPDYGLNKYFNAFLNPELHVVWRVYYKMEIP